MSPEARREQLVEIGARLFAERPFDDVWIEEVAKEAGVSRGLVYHYFPNKKDFFSAIVGQSLREAFELSTPAEDLPPDQWLIEGIDRIFGYAKEHSNVFRAIYTSRHALGGEVLEAIAIGRELQVVRINDLFAPGEPPPETLRTAIHAWAELLNYLMLEWIDGRQTDRQKLVKLAAGTLSGSVITALSVDGNADGLRALAKYAPPVFES